MGTFRDKYNRVQGNCKTADNTGAQWCYTEYGSTCEDQQRSTRFGRQGKTWSYQACSTPSIYSAQCAGYNGGNNAGLPTGQYNNGGFNPYNTGSSGLSGVLQGRKSSKDNDSVKFGRK